MIRRAQVVLWLAAVVVGALAASSAGQGPPGGSPPGLDKAIAAKQKHAEKLLDKPGVAGIARRAEQRTASPSSGSTRRRTTSRTCPTSSRASPSSPSTTGVIEPYDHAADRTGTRDRCRSASRPVSPASRPGRSACASRTGRARYALSNNHVFAGVNTASIGDPIISPGRRGRRQRSRRPHRHARRVPGDRLQRRHEHDGRRDRADVAGERRHRDAGRRIRRAEPDHRSGLARPCRCRSTAARPGSNSGASPATNVSVDVCYIAFGEFCLQEARFVSQISVSPGPFSAPGDSGSLIVTQGGNQPVALLFAGGDGLTIGSPIDLVLQRFGVTIEGAPPGDGPPSAPTALSALAGDASVSALLDAPSFDGGSPVSNYQVYRGTSPARLTFHRDAGTYDDATSTRALDERDDLLLQGVRRERERRGPALERGVARRPPSLVPPVEPLADPSTPSTARTRTRSRTAAAGRTAITGSARAGSTSPSNQLACSKTTTCTAWRNAAQYGPDVEVWARVGDASRHRQPASACYARLQQPGTRPTTGTCCARTSSRAPTRSWLERFDNGAVVTLLTIPQELDRRRHLAPARQRARRSRPGATTARPGRGSASSRTRRTRRRATSASVCAARPGGSTTSARGA